MYTLFFFLGIRKVEEFTGGFRISSVLLTEGLSADCERSVSEGGESIVSGILPDQALGAAGSDVAGAAEGDAEGAAEAALANVFFLRF